MTISDYRTNPTIRFGAIKVGEVFFSPETERFYMRIHTVYSDDEERYDAVDLSDGYLVCFDEDEGVEKVKANITISNP